MMSNKLVTPCVGVWIETTACLSISNLYLSHPAWVCGLKQKELRSIETKKKSHPAWVCGLKLKKVYGVALVGTSHPAWVCGLKRKKTLAAQKKEEVTPCVGVWIETSFPHLPMMWSPVTPCVGVWIETRISLFICATFWSHPAWVCGLKQWW